MAKNKPRARETTTRRFVASSRNLTTKSTRHRRKEIATGAAIALEDASHAGLLEGEKTALVSFRAPPALVEAAKRESGVTSLTELGILGLALLARSDPVAAFLSRTHGRLGGTHTLEY